MAIACRSRNWPRKISQKNLPPVMGRASVAPEGSTNGFGTHIVDVEVDPETGKVTILRYTAIQDAGKAIHPSYVEGQMQGGAVQGIGWALNEEYWFDDQNRMRNASFLDYRMPTCLDVPMIETIIVEVPNPTHPFGVRGVGETPIVPPPAAIANAIYHATGKRLTDLPMSPPKVWKALSSSNTTQLISTAKRLKSGQRLPGAVGDLRCRILIENLTEPLAGCVRPAGEPQ